MTSKCKKSKILPYRPWKMTFRAIQPNLSFDMWFMSPQSLSFDMWFMSPQRSSMPKKKKSYWSVSKIDPSPLNLDGRTDGRTDGQTDRRMTDKSALEKLRCLSAGGAKKGTILTFQRPSYIAIRPNPFLYVVKCHPKRHAKKRQEACRPDSSAI